MMQWINLELINLINSKLIPDMIPGKVWNCVLQAQWIIVMNEL